VIILRYLLPVLLLVTLGHAADSPAPLDNLPFTRTDASVQPYSRDDATLLVLAGRYDLRRTSSPNALAIIDLETGDSQRLAVPLGANTALPCGDRIAVYCDESQVAILIDPAQASIVAATPMPANTRRCTALAADDRYIAVSAGSRTWLCPWSSPDAVELPANLKAACPSPLPDYWLLLNAADTLSLYDPAKQAPADLAATFPAYSAAPISLLEQHAPHGYLVRLAPKGEAAYLARLDSDLRRHGHISLGEPIGVHPTRPLLVVDYLAAVDGSSLLGIVDLNSGALLKLLAVKDYAAVTVGAFVATLDPQANRLHLGIGSIDIGTLPTSLDHDAPAGQTVVRVGETVDWPLPAGLDPTASRLDIAPPGMTLEANRLRWTVPAAARGLHTIRILTTDAPAREWTVRVAE